MPLDVILERFRLEDVQRSPAFFDVKKLSHMNGVYIRALSVDGFVAARAAVGRPGAGGVGAGQLAATPTPGRPSCRRRPGRRSATTPACSPRWPR